MDLRTTSYYSIAASRTGTSHDPGRVSVPDSSSDQHSCSPPWEPSCADGGRDLRRQVATRWTDVRIALSHAAEKFVSRDSAVPFEMWPGPESEVSALVDEPGDLALEQAEPGFADQGHLPATTSYVDQVDVDGEQ